MCSSDLSSHQEGGDLCSLLESGRGDSRENGGVSQGFLEQENSVSDSRPEGCVFKSRWGQSVIFGMTVWGFHDGSHGKESACNAGRCRFHPWVRKIPRRREWQPTPVSLPGESHGQRSLVGYGPRGGKESRHD